MIAWLLDVYSVLRPRYSLLSTSREESVTNGAGAMQWQ